MHTLPTPPDSSPAPRWRGRGVLFLAAALCCAVAPLEVLAAPVIHTVTIESMQFTPQVLEVQRGDTIVWINKDAFPHDATSSGKQIKSPVIAPDARWQFVARRKGSFAYICTQHPMMKARIIVK